jgi:hypothetical protein
MAVHDLPGRCTPGDVLWPHLLKAGKEVGLPVSDRQPPIPWLSVALWPGLAAAGEEVVGLLGDLERCVAWVLIEGQNQPGE